MAPAIKALLLAALSTPLLSGCVVYANDGGEDVTVRMGSETTTVETVEAETLRSARFENGALVVRVDSNGCTDASDFAVALAEGDATDVTLTRQTPDLCKALVPEGVELRWTYEDLGLEAGGAARVTNPIRL